MVEVVIIGPCYVLNMGVLPEGFEGVGCQYFYFFSVCSEVTWVGIFISCW